MALRQNNVMQVLPGLGEGLIVAHSSDERLTYGLMATQNIKFMRYEVDFSLLGHEEGG